MADPSANLYGYPNFSGGGGSSVSIAAGAGLTSNTVGSTQTISASAPYVLWYSDPSITNSRGLLPGLNMTFFNDGTNITLSAQVTGSGATSSGSYLTAVTEAALPQSRVATEGSGITITDGGAGGDMTFAVSSSILGASLLVYATGDTILTGKKLLKAGTNVTLVEDATSIQINSSGGGGGVSSVGLTVSQTAIFDVTNSPITSSGDINLALDTQASSTALMGPVSGANAVPTFRSLASSDIPTIPASKVTGLTNGTVTSVDLALPASTFSISGNPVTTSGTLIGTFVNQPSGVALLGPASGAATTPTWRTLTYLDLLNGLSAGSGITFTPSGDKIAIAATAGGGGTVTDFSAGNLTPLFTTSVSNSTTTPALSFSLSNAPSGTFLGGPSGGVDGAPWYRRIQMVDLPLAVGTVQSVAFTTTNTDIFDVSGSPITSSGTINLSLDNQASGTALMGPINGSPATPAFRTLASSDIPTIPVSKVEGAGTVTSFSAGDLSPLFTTSEATPTTTPALSFAQVAQASSLVFCGPVSGNAANPTFRELLGTDLQRGTIAGSNVTLTLVGDRLQIAATGGGGSPTARSLPTSGYVVAGDYYHNSAWSSTGSLVFDSGVQAYINGDWTLNSGHTLTILTGSSGGIGGDGGIAAQIYNGTNAQGYAAGSPVTLYKGGGGGGGFGGAGGNGGGDAAATKGQGGGTYSLDTFPVGSGGAAGQHFGTGGQVGGRGGNGGGSFYLECAGTATFSEHASAIGLPGGAPTSTAGAGGGGSGGSIEVRATTAIIVSSGKVVVVSGGAGGAGGSQGGGGGGGAGRIRFWSPTITLTGSLVLAGGAAGTGSATSAATAGGSSTAEQIAAAPIFRLQQ